MIAKRNMECILLLFFIGIIFMKDYIVNLFVYLNDSEQGLTYISLKSALFQAITLIIGAMLFLWVKYRVLRKESVYRREKIGTMSEVNNITKVSLREIPKGIVIGILSYLAFNSLKNAYLVLEYYWHGSRDFFTERIVIEPEVFLLVFLIFAILMPIGEELVYRLILFLNFYKEGTKNLILFVFQVVVFAAAHSSEEQMLQATFLAIFLCVILMKTKSIWFCIIVHITYNTIGTVITYYSPMLFLNTLGIHYDMLRIESLVLGAKLLLVFLIVVTVLYIIIKNINYKEIEVSGYEEQKNFSITTIMLQGMILVYSACRLLSIVK